MRLERKQKSKQMIDTASVEKERGLLTTERLITNTQFRPMEAEEINYGSAKDIFDED